MDPHAMATSPRPVSAPSYAARIAFVVGLAERLHRYGTTAQRLEAAIVSVAERLKLDCEPWSNPTGLILSFSDPTQPAGLSDTTRVIREPPGEVDLARLCEVDRIAEAVIAGEIDLAAGHARLIAADRPRSRRWHAFHLLAFGIAAGAVAALLRLPWLDIATAAASGLLVGVLLERAAPHAKVREAGEAIAGVVAAAAAVLVASLVAPINLNTVIIAALIVLLPGLSLTNAMNELATQQLVSGTARFAGALMTVLKLSVGTMLALTVAEWVGLQPQVVASRPQPEWLEWPALLLTVWSFALLFRAARRDYPLVMAAAIVGYLIARFAGELWGSPAGIFLSALSMTALGNAYARWWKRPGALIRVPGIIMLVPGSASLRGLITLLQQQNPQLGQSAMLVVLNILLALVAGLLFGNLLVNPRRNL
jgi:uncharacterized membrane protein YjjP (DUF1212 family)